MEELVTTAIKYHQYFVSAMVLVALVHLYFIQTSKDFSKKVKMLNPIYYMFFSAVAFTGVLVLGINQLHVTHSVYLMIFTWFVIFVMSMRLYKIYKYQSSEIYRAFAKKKYLLDIVLIIVTMGVVYAI